MRADDLILISVDDHIAEPATVFDAHVPAKYRHVAPRVVTDERGLEQWWYGDVRGRNLGLNAVAGKPPEMYNIDASRYDEMRPGCYDVHERVRDMNELRERCTALPCAPSRPMSTSSPTSDGSPTIVTSPHGGR